jgi:hypothetical protein
MPNTTVFLLDVIDSNSLHGPVRELHQDNGISNQINLYYLGLPSVLLASLDLRTILDHLYTYRRAAYLLFARILSPQMYSTYGTGAMSVLIQPKMVKVQCVPKFLYIGIPTTVLAHVRVFFSIVKGFEMRDPHYASCNVTHQRNEGKCGCSVYLIAVDDVHVRTDEDAYSTETNHNRSSEWRPYWDGWL